MPRYMFGHSINYGAGVVHHACRAKKWICGPFEAGGFGRKKMVVRDRILH